LPFSGLAGKGSKVPIDDVPRRGVDGCSRPNPGHSSFVFASDNRPNFCAMPALEISASSQRRRLYVRYAARSYHEVKRDKKDREREGITPRTFA
jgi:hypothetical protein